MKTIPIYQLLLPFLACAFYSCDPPNRHSGSQPDTSHLLRPEQAELMALGSYPDYHYNLAQELNQLGKVKETIEAYESCIAESHCQTFVEDAMYNLSLLQFEEGNRAEGYRYMDSLLTRKYTWLKWYKNVDLEVREEPAFQRNIARIDSLEALKNDPANVTFHYRDVDHFITAFEKSKADWDAAPANFYRDYFSQASSGLYFYQRFKIQSSSHLFAGRVHAREKYFDGALPNLKRLNEKEAELRGYFSKFEELYPEAVFPDVHYVVGCFNAGGTSSPFGLLIGAEMHTMAEGAKLENFSNWEKNVARGFSNLPLIIVHELVHIQQNSKHQDLLGNAIYEGAADFVSELLCGSHINKHVHDWANEREEQVWKDFKAEMYQPNSSNWIGNADRAKDKPADLGYYVGYKICESYYNKQPDKSQAVKDILTISDWHGFFAESGYGD